MYLLDLFGFFCCLYESCTYIVDVLGPCSNHPDIPVPYLSIIQSSEPSRVLERAPGRVTMTPLGCSDAGLRAGPAGLERAPEQPTDAATLFSSIQVSQQIKATFALLCKKHTNMHTNIH